MDSGYGVNGKLKGQLTTVGAIVDSLKQPYVKLVIEKRNSVGLVGFKVDSSVCMVS